MGIEALLSTQIIDTTTVGRAVMTAADATAARTAIGAGTSSFSGAYSALSGIPSTFAPSAHKTSHATGGSDALTAADIGAAATSHTHAAADITSGTIATARLASGTANSTTYLRGDQTWASVSAGINSLNGLTDATQTFAVGTSGTNFAISSAAGVHTFNLPDASATARGVVTTGAQTFAGNKSFSGNLNCSNTIESYWYTGPANRCVIFNNFNAGGGFGYGFSASTGLNNPESIFAPVSSNPGVIRFRYGTSPTGISFTNTYTSTTSFEELSIAWASNVCTIETTKGSAGGTLRGLRIGGSSSALVGLWGATPIVQPTTAVASATRVGGGGTALTDTDTFDGYTLAQIVKALRNIGALA